MTQSDALNILVLHRMGDPREWRSAVRELEFMLPTHAPENRYIVHDADRPLPDFVRELAFDAIVLGPTFLCSRYHPRLFERVAEDYGFIADSAAVKIALPQDEYDCSAVLDRWMVDWGVDLVYSVCPDHQDTLYPTYSAAGQIEPGYTGYIADSWIEAWRDPKPFEDRAIDLSYRASRLPPHFGRIGHLKGAIAGRVRSRLDELGVSDLAVDISAEWRDMIPGDRWHGFLEDSRFCLVTSSGSSLLDPDGEIRRCVARYTAEVPDASFDEVEAHCFPGLDGIHEFTAISPRNLEAGLAQTVQIATPGRYSGLLEPGRHYVPLDEDCANLPEVVAFMRNQTAAVEMAAVCRDALLSVDGLRARNHARAMIARIQTAISGGTPRAAEPMARQAVERYRAEVEETAAAFWARRRLKERGRTLASRLGAGRIKRLLFARVRRGYR